eukprot:scaffold486_cov347-Prasinococcus_capsulatus_cf.AAC.3
MLLGAVYRLVWLRHKTLLLFFPLPRLACPRAVGSNTLLALFTPHSSAAVTRRLASSEGRTLDWRSTIAWRGMMFDFTKRLPRYRVMIALSDVAVTVLQYSKLVRNGHNISLGVQGVQPFRPH